MEAIDLAGGLADPVLVAQRGFRALMDAMANPGTVQSLDLGLAPPAPLTPELAAVALVLCDPDSPVWLDSRLGVSDAVVAWLNFHIAAPLTAEPGAAQFALVTGADTLPLLNAFALGSDQYPDSSTTVVLALPGLDGGPSLALSGPGIKGTRMISPLGLPGDFVTQRLENRERFPRGVDLLLVADGAVIGLPRTTRITEGGR
jgi:alpha-D-ribose 1-methylphosphonate 5-triphosphate synthase subunit PhnH